MMIPAPDQYRCPARHPDQSLVRCFRTVHGDEVPHQAEKPRGSKTYHATDVLIWRDSPRPSEFALGPCLTP